MEEDDDDSGYWGWSSKPTVPPPVRVTEPWSKHVEEGGGEQPWSKAVERRAAPSARQQHAILWVRRAPPRTSLRHSSVGWCGFVFISSMQGGVRVRSGGANMENGVARYQK
ncbi:hypothetical protein ABZP36_028284 [Zizania latifolia]